MKYTPIGGALLQSNYLRRRRLFPLNSTCSFFSTASLPVSAFFNLNEYRKHFSPSLACFLVYHGFPLQPLLASSGKRYWLLALLVLAEREREREREREGCHSCCGLPDFRFLLGSLCTLSKTRLIFSDGDLGKPNDLQSTKALYGS